MPTIAPVDGEVLSEVQFRGTLKGGRLRVLFNHVGWCCGDFEGRTRVRQNAPGGRTGFVMTWLGWVFMTLVAVHFPTNAVDILPLYSFLRCAFFPANPSLPTART